jgi:hypothetical protein
MAMLVWLTGYSKLFNTKLFKLFKAIFEYSMLLHLGYFLLF